MVMIERLVNVETESVRNYMDKQQLKEREARVIELATAFCKKHLDEECAELIEDKQCL